MTNEETVTKKEKKTKGIQIKSSKRDATTSTEEYYLADPTSDLDLALFTTAPWNELLFQDKLIAFVNEHMAGI